MKAAGTIENAGRARPSRLRALIELAAFGLAFLALVDLSWRFLGPFGYPIYWFPEGLATGVLLRVEKRRWPHFLGTIALALFAAGIFGFPPHRAAPPAVQVVWALEDMAVPLSIAWALRRTLGSPFRLQRPVEVAGLVLASLLIAPAIVFLFSTVLWTLWPSGRGGTDWQSFFLRYLAQHTTPVLAFVPVIVTWPAHLPPRPGSRTMVEIAAIVVLLAVLSGVGYLLPTPALQIVALSIAAFPLLGWAAARFGPVAAAQGAFILSIAGTVLTLAGHGPFGDPAIGVQRLIFVQGFFAVATISALLVAAEATARRSHEAQQDRLYREAQAAVRVRDDFLSIASHELKTPLTALSLRIQGLRRKLATEHSGDVRLADKALVSLEKLQVLINDLLDASRIEHGGLPLEDAPIDLGRLVAEAAAATAVDRARHQLRLDIPATPVCVGGDPARLGQVIDNLVANALKYSPQGGMVLVGLETRGEEVVLSVADQGIGIPPDQLPYLFDRFFRARNAGSNSYGGLGLGLYIVHEIVTRHGGRIWVDSQVGMGSTFFVALPRLHASAHPAMDAVL